MQREEAIELPNNAAWPDWDKRNYLDSELASLQKRFDAYMERTKNRPETIPGIVERRTTGFRNNIAKKREQLALGRIPLAFLGQFSMREISAIAPIPGWPDDGILAFFYDADQIWGYDPIHRGHCCVMFFPECASLTGVEFPQSLPDNARHPKRPLKFIGEWTLPTDLESNNGEPAFWKTDQYRDLVNRLSIRGIGETVHRLGGYPQEIQGDMRLECQLVTHGLNWGDGSWREDTRRAELEKGALDWQLLVQFDSDEARLGWMWGDVGRVYFWARRQDIEAADFSSSWAILQCG
jgi:uncharacterized protein YwqG